ncbi:hypothetical protein ADU37_CDS00250 [Thermococcus sp. 2319x1]|uniref:DUF835 domain-containing protein n=1 Tax=Thermococcus sp. 2319x1 TaxID=1674923 RepID=UPI00073A73DD|nr:DUF835 domain-containing protein [Thermococcus sp. 2319x1]ALV61724.1 hypothetical protein ADU37_CDS00250 [Thermococcus sp. 2319x1]
MYMNILGVLAGTILVVMGIALSLRALYYYKNIQEPGKNLAKKFLISASLFVAGSLGVVVDSLSEAKLWLVSAIFYTLSYIILVSSVVYYLSALSPTEIKPRKYPRKISLSPITGAYAFKKPVSPHGLAFLSRHSNGVLVVSRTQKELWVKKYRLEPDKFIWLSRLESNEAADPTKLHVIQDAILRFLKERGGKAVVYFEGIEYLILYNNFSSVAKFLFSLKDYVISNESMLILYLPPNVLDKTQETILLKEFQEKREEELIKEIS